MNRIFTPRPLPIRTVPRRFCHPTFRLRDEAEAMLRDMAYVLALSRKIAADVRKPDA